MQRVEASKVVQSAWFEAHEGVPVETPVQLLPLALVPAEEP